QSKVLFLGRHTARLVTGSRAAVLSAGVVWTGDRETKPSACFRPAAPRRGTPFPPQGRGGPLPLLPRYYEVLRFPHVLPATLRFLRMTGTTPCACVRCSDQIRRRSGAWGFRVWQPHRRQYLERWQRKGVPSSWGTLVCLCPVL